MKAAHRVKRLMGTLLLAAATPAAAQTIPAPAEFEGVRRVVQQAIEAGVSPSVSVAVVRNDSLVWAEGFGHADVERQLPATPNSIYLLASISKPLTGAGLMTLVDRGLIDLDEPVNRYLDGAAVRAYVGEADAITLRRLANHTAGLPVHYNFYYGAAEPLPVDEAVRRYGFAAWAPGSRWEYSNLAYGILEHVTERVAGVSWREHLEQSVFDPAGMTRTSERVRPGFEADATAQYVRDAAGRWLRVDAYRFDHAGASTLWSSALDLARFARLFWHGGTLDGQRVLSETATQEMLRQTSDRGDGSGNGVGWFVGSYFGQPSFWHSGGMPGVSTMLRAYPESRTATVVLTNSSDRTMANEVTRRLAEVLFPGAGEAPSPPTPTSAPNARPLTGTWSGRIAHFDGDIPLRRVVGANGEVEAFFNGRPAGPLAGIAASTSELRGRIDAMIRTQSGFHGVPTLEFRLEPNGERLTGVAVALATNYYALSHWVELEREP